MKIDSSISAVVTGGASGLGRATAEALAASGVKVAIFDINDALGEEVAASIGGLFVHVDITDEQSVLDGYAKARAAHGQERVCVHCAMTSRRGKTLAYDKESGKFRRTPTEDYAYGVAGILTASYRVGSIAAEGMATLPEMEDGERGAIIFTASVAAQDAQIGQVIYGSAKAGVNGLVLPMARDLMDLGIRVNSIMPGVFGTPLLGNMNPKVKESLEASVPFPKRLGKAEEYASLAMEMVRNSYFNGQAVRLDGAWPSDRRDGLDPDRHGARRTRTVGRTLRPCHHVRRRRHGARDHHRTDLIPPSSLRTERSNPERLTSMLDCRVASLLAMTGYISMECAT